MQTGLEYILQKSYLPGLCSGNELDGYLRGRSFDPPLFLNLTYLSLLTHIVWDDTLNRCPVAVRWTCKSTGSVSGFVSDTIPHNQKKNLSAKK